MTSTVSTACLRGSNNSKQENVTGINRSDYRESERVVLSKKRKRERAFESGSPSPVSVAFVDTGSIGVLADRIDNDISDSDCGEDDNGCNSNNDISDCDSSDWDSSDCDCDCDCDDDSSNDSDDKNTTDLRGWDSKHYLNIFDGCYNYNDDFEDCYLDAYFRSSTTTSSTAPTAKLWNQKYYFSEATTDGWFRVLFQSQMTLNEVESKLEDWLALMLRMFENDQAPIEHLFFGNEVTVKEFERNVPPVLFPINLLGKILELCHRNGIRGSNKYSYRCCLKTLTLNNLLFVGRTRDEFDCAFRQLSRCDSILEIVVHDCDFHVMDGSSDDPLLESRRLSFDEDSFARVPFNSLVFKGMLMAFNEMESLEVIDIDNNRDMIFDDIFADALLHNPKKAKKKPIKVLSISKCVLSDFIFTAIFGKDSRVERFHLVNCGDLQGRLPLIANLLKNENRTMQNLQLRNWFGVDTMGVPETLELLKALGSNALGPNHALKHLHLDVNCKHTKRSSVLFPPLNAKTARSFCEAIEHLAGLESLALDFLLFAPVRNNDYDDEVAVDFDDDHCKASLRHIWSMLEDGIGNNDTLRAFQFMVSGINSPANSEEKEKFKTWVSEEVNRSLTHALSSSTPAASLSRTRNQAQSSSPLSKTTKKRSPLQEYRFYVDGSFDVDPDPTTAFWLSLNENGIHKLLHQRSDDLELWRDAIVRHSSSGDAHNKTQASTIDSSIVYHVLRETNGLLRNRNNNNTAALRPRVDS